MRCTLANWKEFTVQAPEMAAAAGRLLGLGSRPLGYLATVSEEGRPRIAPVRPILAADNLYLILAGDSPRAADLLRGGSIALHAPLGPDDEELALAGSASLIVYGYEREAAQRATGGAVDPDDLVFRLAIGNVLHVVRESAADPGAAPRSQAWQA
jgi:hypothetical protein